MTLEFNTDHHNNMLIAFITGSYDFEKIVKVINMTLEKCLDKDLKRALIDMAQISNLDIQAIEKVVFSSEMATSWKQKIKMCIVCNNKSLPETEGETKNKPEDWVLITSNKNQSVFWLLSD